MSFTVTPKYLISAKDNYSLKIQLSFYQQLTSAGNRQKQQHALSSQLRTSSAIPIFLKSKLERKFKCETEFLGKSKYLSSLETVSHSISQNSGLVRNTQKFKRRNCGRSRLCVLDAAPPTWWWFLNNSQGNRTTILLDGFLL